MSSNPYRLPRTAVPRHYALTIEPDLDAATFRGCEIVAITVTEPVTEIVLNAAELEIDAVELVSGTDATRMQPTPILDEPTERVSLQFEAPVLAGEYELHLEFRGVLNDQLRGFYRATHVDEEGESRTIGVTQFEATDARRAFPCWDEPDLKATFSVTLVVEDDLFAVSNTSVVEQEPAAGGKRRVRFADTMVMSTYLVAWVVGKLAATDPVDVDGVPLRIVHEPGKGHLTGYALDAAAFALRYLRDYYGIPYPGDKLDLIAVPDFAWGAMENLGAVTFRDNLLIVDPAGATQRELQRIVDVIGHEIAHMWFGDLVTMKWWNGIWLNEAFATFMEVKTTDAFQPEWNRWVDFGTDAGTAKEIDALAATRPIEFHVESPDEANEMFDSLTYEKGSAVLRMLEQFIGEDAFRRGVGDYLRRHAYDNAETVDLWQALEKASGEPVAHIMDTWILQGGFPLVTVGSTERGYRLEQSHFRLLDEGTEQGWSIPMLWRRIGTEDVERVLLDEPIEVETDAPAVFNAGGHGFYVVHYDDAALAAVADRYSDLSALERFLLVDDTWSLTLAGKVSVGNFLGLVDQIGDELAPPIWDLVVGAFTELDRIVPDSQRDALQARVGSVLAPRLAAIGWESREGDDEQTRKLRAILFRGLGRLAGDEDAVRRSRDIVAGLLAGSAAADPDVAAAAVGVVAWHGTDEDFDRYAARIEDAPTPQDRVRFLFSLPSFPTEDHAARMIEMSLDGRIRAQDAPTIIASMLMNRRINTAAWKMLQERWAEIHDVVPDRISRLIHRGLRGLTHPETADDVRDWFVQNPSPHPKSLAQRLELLAVYERFRHREGDDLHRALS